MCSGNIASKVMDGLVDKTKVKELNKVVQKIHDTAQRGLRYQKLYILLLRVVATSNASFANSIYISSQLGHIIILTDNTGREIF